MRDVTKMRGGRRIGGTQPAPQPVIQPATMQTTSQQQRDLMMQQETQYEGKVAWRSWLERGVAERKVSWLHKALEHCRTEAERSVVHYALGIINLKASRQLEAVEHLAVQKVAPFEETALELWSDRSTLAAYASAKLSSLSPDEKTQRTMLCVWLIDLYLQRRDVASAVEVAQGYPDAAHGSTVCEIVASHGDEEEVLEQLSGGVFDEELFAARMFTGRYKKALRQQSSDRAYDASVALLRDAPEEALAAWSEDTSLDIEKLLPALMLTKTRSANLASTSSTSRAVRLAALEAASEDEIVSSLQAPGGGLEPYELQFTLRLCTRKKMNRACVYAAKELGLFEEAADVAVSKLDDVDLAKYVAAAAEEDDVKRRIWLTIARRVVSANVADSAALLEECPLLSIEDILPLCPDFVVIETFKNEIVKSLQDYDGDLDAIKAEMADYSKSVANIRQEMANLHAEPVVMPPDTLCALSGKPVLKPQAGAFYYFSSGLAYLATSLHDYMVPHFPLEKRKHAEHLRGELERRKTDDPTRRDIEIQLDSLIAQECPLTGEMMIDSIDAPLTTAEDEAKWAFE